MTIKIAIGMTMLIFSLGLMVASHEISDEEMEHAEHEFERTYNDFLNAKQELEDLQKEMDRLEDLYH